MTTGMLISALLIGAVGFVMLVRGKREAQAGTFLTGIALSVLPLLMHSVGLLWLASAGVVGAWGVLRRFGPTGGPVA